MWSINKWYYQVIDIEIDLLYTTPEEQIYTNDLIGMSEAIEEWYTYDYKLALIQFFYFFLQTVFHLFNEYINDMNLMSGFKQCKAYTYLL